MASFRMSLLGLGLCATLLYSATAFSEDSLQEEVVNAATSLASKNASVESVVSYGLNRTASKASQAITERLKKHIPTVEVDMSVTSEGKPTFGALILNPIIESEENDKLLFLQGSIFRRDSRTTGNIGLGARKLTKNDTVLLGANAFYDYEFPYNHQRMSIGAEIRSTVGELNANYYQALSGWNAGRGSLDERVLDGYDVEVGVPLPYMPTTKAYVQRFRWDSQSGTKLEHGFTYAIESEIFNGVTVEVGHKNYNNSDDENIASVRINLVEAFSKERKKPFIAKKAYSLESMKEARYDKVRRENLIRKEFRNTNPLVMNITGF